ncbi:dicarboxylate/amino acid:cation symporter [uncultured Sphingomonas sp.]|uniref:dicarboxylate/amino acid:cation symporter n=1 Tax=uncultured Sphingomonas sp. TaxID=158754 RepID=UPI0035CA6DA9
MSQPTRILLALVIGLVGGILLATWSPGAAEALIPIAQPIGTAWLNGLQMTIVPLVVSLLITGVAATAEAARAGRLAGRAILLFVGVLFCTATTSALLSPLIVRTFPLPVDAAASLRAALTDAGPVAPTPPIADLLAAVVPTNIVAAAGANAFLSIIIFTLVFAFAILRIEPDGRERLTGFFVAVRDAMLVVVGWVLVLAPIGVFALAFVVGGRAGVAAFGALLHYIVAVSAIGVVVYLGSFVLASVGGKVGPLRFLRASFPAQAVAISTQSSLATLPAMLKVARGLGIPVATSGVVLPLAVAIFRGTQPAMNLAVSIYIAAWLGIPLTPGLLVAAVVVAALTSLGSASLPSQITFVSAIAPIAGVLGVPLAPLGLLIAVETIPDIFRTVGNVMMDLAATATVSRRNRDVWDEGGEEAE